MGAIVDFTSANDLLKTVDDEIGVVFGWAIVCEDDGIEKSDPDYPLYFDLHGDHIPEDAMLKASTDFMLDHRNGKVMHRGEVVGDIVFAWPQTREIAKKFGEECTVFGLKIGWKPRDADLLAKFKDGTYAGFSIGGSYGEIEEVPDA